MNRETKLNVNMETMLVVIWLTILKLGGAIELGWEWIVVLFVTPMAASAALMLWFAWEWWRDR